MTFAGFWLQVGASLLVLSPRNWASYRNVLFADDQAVMQLAGKRRPASDSFVMSVCPTM